MPVHESFCGGVRLVPDSPAAAEPLFHGRSALNARIRAPR